MTQVARGGAGHGARLANLDLLRLVLALSVLLFHYVFLGPLKSDIGYPVWPALAPLVRYGYIGVSVFFCISGFVIAWSSSGRSASAFLAARLSRLYPAYLACVCLTGLAMIVWHGASPALLLRIVANLPMFPGVLRQHFIDPVYWSLVTEMRFYFWTFLLIALGLFERHQLAICLGWLLLAALDGVLPYLLGSVLITPYAAYFVLGITTYRLWRYGATPIWLALAALALLLAVRTEWAAAVALGYEDGLPGLFVPWQAAGVFLAGFGLFLLAVLMHRPILPAALCIAAGGASYPLYLLHDEIGFALFSLPGVAQAPRVALVVIIAVTLGLSLLVWWVVERPGVPALRRLLQALEPRLAARFPLWPSLARVPGPRARA
jgi:peptidoglycan/LPS O-acetylase OafA/YrhL